METRSWLSAARGPSLTSNAYHAGASTSATTLPPSLGTGATACQLDHPGRPGKLVQSPEYTGRRRGNRRQGTTRLTLHRTLVAAFPACPAAPCPACLVVGGASRGPPVGDFDGESGKRPNVADARTDGEELSSTRRVVDGPNLARQMLRPHGQTGQSSNTERGFGSVGLPPKKPETVLLSFSKCRRGSSSSSTKGPPAWAYSLASRGVPG